MEFLVLGTLEVRRDGHALTVTGARQRAVLALLVLHAGEPVSGEQLAIGLWGEDASAAAAKTIQVYVSRLRAALADPGVLVTTDAGYVLRVAPDAIDAIRFERLYRAGAETLRTGRAGVAATQLREALALWRGPALADFAGEGFAQPEIARLEELRLAAVEACAEADLAAGRHRELVPELRRRVADEPLRETGYRQLMLALSRSGRHADALAVYRDARRTLVETLGIEPSAELRELERRVLADEAGAPAEPGKARVPRPPTPTVGRDTDLERLGSLLARHSLVTVVGPGGVGKTRLAVEAARAGAATHPDGADLVSLAGTSDGAEVASAIVRQLAIALIPGEDAGAALVRELERRELLLVLDNFEHLLDAAPLVAHLIESCPRVTVLVTSREPLRVRSERIFRLEPLTLHAAVEQFTTLVEARDQVVTDAGAADEICRRLDGLPLAIELAAGRIGALSVGGLAARLREGLDVLGPGARDAPERQRTLATTIAWSFDLASARERSAVTALAVFAGGCTLEAAETVSGAALEVLDALVAKNLVVARDGRLTLLETIREFALARLVDGGAVRARHCAYFLGVAEQAAGEIDRTGASGLLARHDVEVDNFRGALSWAIENRDTEVALRLATALHPYWRARELRTDAARWLQAALALEGDDVPVSVRTRALNAYSEQIASVGDIGQAEAAVNESLAIGGPSDRAAGLCALAFLRLRRHRVTEAYDLAGEAERLATDAQTRLNAIEIRAMMAPTLDEALALGGVALDAHRAAGHERKLGRLLASLAYTALFHDDPATAARLCAEALDVASEPADPFLVTLAEGNAGLAALFVGDLPRAAQAFTRQLRIADRHGYDFTIFEPLSGFAVLAACAGRDRLAARLLGAARVSSADWHDPLIAERLEARFLAPARARLGAAAWEAEEAAGARADRASVLAAAYDAGDAL
ncbi:BTAD domain-containing putative transcriptional regulator [Solirubrobacter soli]|uniref:BTAD domain-containing putative transcriptional regulator n=1 Tax=Solirubrobacter soli TaxID=363832 RepID=UPI0003F8F7C9|nr:BTAD domain-containing putative transcriptional regulator [Solirubrobacter soli]